MSLHSLVYKPFHSSHVATGHLRDTPCIRSSSEASLARATQKVQGRRTRSLRTDVGANLSSTTRRL